MLKNAMPTFQKSTLHEKAARLLHVGAKRGENVSMANDREGVEELRRDCSVLVFGHILLHNDTDGVN